MRKKYRKIMVFGELSDYKDTHLQEVQDGAFALYEKHLTDGKGSLDGREAELYWISSEYPSAMGDDHQPIKYEFEVVVGKINPERDDQLGIYYLAHGGAETAFPATLLKHLTERGWGPNNLAYVNLVVCFASPKTKATDATWQIPKDNKAKTFPLAQFAQALMKAGLQPRLAGYAGFVTVANQATSQGVRPKDFEEKASGHKIVSQYSGYKFLSGLNARNTRNAKHEWKYREDLGYYEVNNFNESKVEIRSLPLSTPSTSLLPSVPQGTFGNPLRVKDRATWVLDKERPHCARCGAEFGFFSNWQHHCRVCGEVCCDGCCKENAAYVHNPLSDTAPLRGVHQCRVCNACLST